MFGRGAGWRSIVGYKLFGPVLGRPHADTRQIRYEIAPGLGVDTETLNREIRRFIPEPGARSHATNPVFAEFTGKIRVPVMALHETADFRVPFRLQQDYRRRTESAGTRLASW